MEKTRGSKVGTMSRQNYSIAHVHRELIKNKSNTNETSDYGVRLGTWKIRYAYIFGVTRPNFHLQISAF